MEVFYCIILSFKSKKSLKPKNEIRKGLLRFVWRGTTKGTMFLFGFIYWEATGFHTATKIYLWSHRNPHPSHSLDYRPEMIWHEIEDKRVKSKGPVLQGSQISRRGRGDVQLVATNQVVLHQSSRVIFSCPPLQPRLNNSCKSNNYTSGSLLQNATWTGVKRKNSSHYSMHWFHEISPTGRLLIMQLNV